MNLRKLVDPSFRAGIEGQIGRTIEYHEVIDSTQRRARSLKTDWPTVVVADHQTAGRGTRDRVWHASRGQSLLCSWIFPKLSAPHATLAAGVAIARAIEALGAPPEFAVKGGRTHVALKWPNDVQVGGRKIAGALAHVSGDPGTLVVGVGVNVHQQESDFPEELRASATSLRGLGLEIDRLALFVRLAAELDRALADPEETVRVWRARSPLLGREVTVERAGEPQLHGIVRDLAPDGALVLETAYGRERILAGEVVLR